MPNLFRGHLTQIRTVQFEQFRCLSFYRFGAFIFVQIHECRGHFALTGFFRVWHPTMLFDIKHVGCHLVRGRIFIGFKSENIGLS